MSLQITEILDFGQQLDALRTGFILMLLAAVLLVVIGLALLYTTRASSVSQGTSKTDAEADSKREDTHKIAVETMAQIALRSDNTARDLGRVLTENAQVIQQSTMALQQLTQGSLIDHEKIQREITERALAHEEAAAERAAKAVKDVTEMLSDNFLQQNSILKEVHDTLKSAVDKLKPAAELRDEVQKAVRLLEKLTGRLSEPIAAPLLETGEQRIEKILTDMPAPGEFKRGTSTP